MKYIKIIASVIGIFIVLTIAFIMTKKSAYAPVDLSTILIASYSGGATVNDIRNISIAPGSEISSPLRITGEARGPWYFEASFPVVLTDGDGLIIAEGHGQAQGEWMTTGDPENYFLAHLKYVVEHEKYGSKVKDWMKNSLEK